MKRQTFVVALAVAVCLIAGSQSLADRTADPNRDEIMIPITDEPVLNFPPRYIVTGSMTVKCNPTTERFKQWYNPEHNLTRIDYYDGVHIDIYDFRKQSPKQMYSVEWRPDKSTGESIRTCNIIPKYAQFPSAVPYSILPDLRFMEMVPCTLDSFDDENDLLCERWETDSSAGAVYHLIVNSQGRYSEPVSLKFIGANEFLPAGNDDDFEIFYDSFVVPEADSDLLDPSTVFNVSAILPSPIDCTERPGRMPVKPLHEVESRGDTNRKVEREFARYTSQYGKQYGDEQEYRYRMQIFGQNLQRIDAHNRRSRNSKQGINQFTDMTEQEVQQNVAGCAYRLPYNDEDKNNNAANELNQTVADSELPENFDLRTLNAVSSVKDQLACDSCWAFSAASSIEGAVAYQKQTPLVEASVQQLIDCSAEDGCHGGSLNGGIDFAQQFGGINLAQDYGEYLSVSDKCHGQRNGTLLKVKENVNVQGEELLKKALFKYGPVAIAVFCDRAFSDYSGGVLYNENCVTNDANHAVLAVGYGVDRSGPDGPVSYWLVKNSWGPYWGEDGFIRIDARCDYGLTSSAFVPIIE